MTTFSLYPALSPLSVLTAPRSVIGHARSFLATRPVWLSWHKQINQAVSTTGGLESIGWRHPNPEGAIQAREAIFRATLANAHAYCAVELARQWPQAELLAAAEDFFVVGAPQAPESALAFRRLPSLRTVIQKGASR